MLIEFFAVLMSLSIQTAPEEEAKAIRAIVQEMERTPSLYGRFDKATDIVAPPKSSPAKLKALTIDERESFEKERMRRNADKDKYDAAHPVRAAVFAAVEASQDTQRRIIRLEFPGGAITPKVKAAVARDQSDVAAAIFHLEQVLEQMREAEAERNKEPRKHWQAHFDWARAQLEADLIFLLEHNYLLGAIRADRLPALGKGDVGWKAAFVAGATAPEPKLKALVKARDKHLKKMEEDYAGTPWAHFAERERQRSLGMEWEPRKE